MANPKMEFKQRGRTSSTISTQINQGLAVVSQALGVSKATDFSKLKEMQRQRVASIAGISKDDMLTEGLLSEMVDRAGIDKDMDKLDTHNIKIMNMAFKKDLAKYSSNIPPEEIDMNNLSMKRSDMNKHPFKDSSKKDDRKHKNKSVFRESDENLTDQRYQSLLQNEEKVKKNRLSPEAKEFQRFYASKISLIQKSTEKVHPSASSSTIYENKEKTRPNGLRTLSYSNVKHKHGKSDILWDSEYFVSEEQMKRLISKAVQATSSDDHSPQITQIDDINIKALMNPGFYAPKYMDGKFPDVVIIKKPTPQNESAAEFLYGREAYNHYLRFYENEQTLLHDIWLHYTVKRRKQLHQQKAEIQEALEAAKDFYSNNSRSKDSGWLKERMRALFNRRPSTEEFDAFQKPSEIRKQLDELSVHKAWFMYAISGLQVVGLLVLCLLGGITFMGIKPVRQTSDQVTWGGLKEVEHFDVPNLWIGPSQRNLIKLGGLFSPCLRAEQTIQTSKALYEIIRLSDFGCCEITGIGAGTTTEAECTGIVTNNKIPGYFWRNGSTCENRLYGRTSLEVHMFKPCCFGERGGCDLLTQSHCLFIQGRWFASGVEHCSLAKCDMDMCLVGTEQIKHSEKDNSVDIIEILNMNKTSYKLGNRQIWRLPLSLLYHQGVVHFFIVAILQLHLGIEVEKVVGWYRVSIIYVLSGLLGLLFGVTLSPSDISLGGGGAVAGLIAVHLVELVQAWKLIKNPEIALLKLIGLLLIFFIAGLFSQVNQYIQVGGFIFGGLLGVICLPYITFNHWHSKARVILVAISLCIVTFGTVSLWFTFYTIQPHHIGVFKMLNCIPVFNYTCDEDLP